MNENTLAWADPGILHCLQKEGLTVIRHCLQKEGLKVPTHSWQEGGIDSVGTLMARFVLSPPRHEAFLQNSFGENCH